MPLGISKLWQQVETKFPEKREREDEFLFVKSGEKQFVS